MSCFFERDILEAAINLAIDNFDLIPSLIRANGTSLEDVGMNEQFRDLLLALQDAHLRDEQLPRCLLVSRLSEKSARHKNREDWEGLLAQMQTKGRVDAFPLFLDRLAALRLRRQLVSLAELAQNGTSDAHLIERLERVKVERQGAFGFRFKNWDLSPEAFAELSQTPWVIEPLLAPPDVLMLVGDGGVGKSKLAAAAALSVAFGPPLWGHFRVARSGRVVYMNEERPDLTVRHLHTLAPNLGIDPAQVKDRIELIGGGLRTWRVTDPAARQALVWRVKELRDVLLIISDSLHVLHDKEENDNAQMTAVIEGFRQISREALCCSLILHHRGKNTLGDAAMSARGASAIKDSVDGQFLIRRVKDDQPAEIRISQDKTRRALVPPFQLRLEHDDLGDIVGIKWLGKAPNKVEEALPAVLDIISASPKLLKSGEIALALAGRFRKETVYEVLTRVRKENLAPWRQGDRQGFLYGGQDEESGE